MGGLFGGGLTLDGILNEDKKNNVSSNAINLSLIHI